MLLLRILGDKSSLTLCKSPPPGLSLARYVLQGADQTRLSVGQTFGSLSLIQRLRPRPVTHYLCLLGGAAGVSSVWALTWKYLPASQNQIIYDLL